MKKAYFTIEPTDSGFTDQLMQFSAFYKLGLHLGLNYIHTPFVSTRSSAIDLPPPAPARSGHWAATGLGEWLRARLPTREVMAPEVHEFIGLNRYFELDSKPAPADCEGIRSQVIELSDDTLLELADESLESLAGHIGGIIRGFPGAADANAETVDLVKFRLEGARGRLFSLIQRALPNFQDGLDLPAIYSAARVRAPVKSLFRRRALRIVVHIRQGDTGVVETPWNTYVPLWHVIKNRFKEHDRFDQIHSSELLFEVSEYKAFLDGFLDRLGRPRRSVLVFSDGASRSFRMIESNIVRLGWSDEKAKRFFESEAEYDRRQFSCFSRSRDVCLFVGEEPIKLCQLIDSAIGSDIVIVSSQQRMIPKLVANFCGADSPKVIVLYKKEPPFNTDIIHDDEDRFIYVDIDNPDYDSLMRRVQGHANPRRGGAR